MIVPQPPATNLGVVATISGVAFNGSAYGPVSAAPSAAVGSYSFGSDIPPGTYSVTLSLSGYNPATVSGISVVAGARPRCPPHPHARDRDVTGTVTASANGTGITADPGSALITVSGSGLRRPRHRHDQSLGRLLDLGRPREPCGNALHDHCEQDRLHRRRHRHRHSRRQHHGQRGATITVERRDERGLRNGPCPARRQFGGGGRERLRRRLQRVVVRTGQRTPERGGGYIFGSIVPPGTYPVTLSLSGYIAATISDVVGVAGSPTTLPTTALGRAARIGHGNRHGVGERHGDRRRRVGRARSPSPGGLYRGHRHHGSARELLHQRVPVNPSGMPYAMTATKSNYVATGTTTATPVANNTVAAAGTIALTVATSTVSGTVSVPAPATNSAGVIATISGIAFNGSDYGPVAASASAAAGTYSFGNVIPPGTYSVTLTLSAYNPVTLTGVAVVAGSATTVPPRRSPARQAPSPVPSRRRPTGPALPSTRRPRSSRSPARALDRSHGDDGSVGQLLDQQRPGEPVRNAVHPHRDQIELHRRGDNHWHSGRQHHRRRSRHHHPDRRDHHRVGNRDCPSTPGQQLRGVVASITGVAFNGASYAPATR